MASTEKKPKKGILKNSSSFDKTEPPHLGRKEMKWDEMNIIATHHPPDKDYGHMKIDEPPTPYAKYAIGEEADEEGCKRRGSVEAFNSEDEQDQLDPLSVALKLEGEEGPKVLKRASMDDDVEDESSDEDRVETEEERAERKLFEMKRTLHYNEFQAMRLAKQLMEEEDDDDDDDAEQEDPMEGELDEAALNAAKNAHMIDNCDTHTTSGEETSMATQRETDMEGASRVDQADGESSCSMDHQTLDHEHNEDSQDKH